MKSKQRMIMKGLFICIPLLHAHLAFAEIGGSAGVLIYRPSDLNQTFEAVSKAPAEKSDLGQDLPLSLGVFYRADSLPFKPRFMVDYWTSKGQLKDTVSESEIVAKQSIQALGVVGGPTWDVNVGQNSIARFHGDIGVQAVDYSWETKTSNSGISSAVDGKMGALALVPILQVGQALHYSFAAKAKISAGVMLRFSRIQGFKVGSASGAFSDQKNETFTYQEKAVPMDLSCALFSIGISYGP
jgi:hypothetical protein